MRDLRVAMSRAGSSTSGRIASSIMAGSMSGSSPWTLTMISASLRAATSARRSVPVSCPLSVISTRPPNAFTAATIRSSSVATITSDTREALAVRS